MEGNISIKAYEGNAVKEIIEIRDLHLSRLEKEMWIDFDLEQLKDKEIFPKVVNFKKLNNEIICFACDRDFCNYAGISYEDVDDPILDIELATLEFYRKL